MTFEAALDRQRDDAKNQVSDPERACVRCKRPKFHGEWNYTRSPRK
jgi:hypothetical protein